MNIIKIKKLVRKYTVIRNIADYFYFLFTGQLSQPRKSYGEKNPDKTFYVIRPLASKIGLINLYTQVVGHIYYAELKGYTPIVDFENYKIVHSADYPVNSTNNAWEYYFEQVSEYTLKEVYESKNVILSRRKLRYADNNVIIRNNEKLLNQFYRISNKYIKLNKYTNEYLKNVRKELINDSETVLGVFCRGTDYINLAPPGHPIQPTFGELIKETERYIKEWNCDKILLTTEDLKAVEAFKDVFKDKLIIPKQNFISDWNINSGMLIEDYRSTIYNDKYKNGLDYLISVSLLSECDYLIGGIAGGLFGAVMLNGGKYKNKKVIYKGLY